MESDSFKRFMQSPYGPQVLQALNTEAITNKLYNAVDSNHVEEAMYWLCQGGDPNYMHPEQTLTALHNAASKGLMLAASLLILNHANVDLACSAADTPAQYPLPSAHKFTIPELPNGMVTQSCLHCCSTARRRNRARKKWKEQVTHSTPDFFPHSS